MALGNGLMQEAFELPIAELFQYDYRGILERAKDLWRKVTIGY